MTEQKPGYSALTIHAPRSEERTPTVVEKRHFNLAKKLVDEGKTN